MFAVARRLKFYPNAGWSHLGMLQASRDAPSVSPISRFSPQRPINPFDEILPCEIAIALVQQHCQTVPYLLAREGRAAPFMFPGQEERWQLCPCVCRVSGFSRDQGQVPFESSVWRFDCACKFLGRSPNLEFDELFKIWLWYRSMGLVINNGRESPLTQKVPNESFQNRSK